jgi:type I restriction enzyme S subunit
MKPGYKQTEVGIIPEEWDVAELSAVTTQIGDGLHGTPLYSPNGSYFFINGNNLGDGRIVFTNETQSVGRAEFIKHRKPLGDRSILMSINGTIGNLALFNDEPVMLGKSVAFLNVSPRVSKNFIYHSLRAPKVKQQFVGGLTGSTIGNLGLATIRGTKIPLPPSEDEQRAIATALSDVDGLLGGLDRLIAKKRDLKQAAMQQLLTGQTRLPGWDGVWDVKRLGDVGVFTKGSGIKKDEVVADGLPCIRYGEIYTHHNDHVRVYNSFVTPETAKQSQRLVKGDLLFAGSGETSEEIGKCVAFLWDHEAYAGGDIVILRPIGQSSAYLGYLLNHSSVAVQKSRLGQGDAVVHISARNLARVDLRLPPLPEQTAIAEVLTEMDAELAGLEQRREKTRALKQAMMHSLLTGRTRLV